MRAVSPFLARQYDFDFKVKSKLPESLEQLRRGAVSLTNARTGGLILKAAASETLLAAYRRRFLAALPGMVNMRRENFRRADPRVDRALARRFLESSARYNAAKVKGDLKALARARTTMDNARDSVRRQLRPDRRSKRPLPHGQFRRLALRVMELIADVNEAQVFVAQGAVVLGIGQLAALDRIQTPSATPQLTGRATSSSRTTLWRHLEFGTGAFATDKSQQLQRHRLSGGGWWYGRSPNQALHLRGSQPANAIGDPKRKLPYAPESTRFYTALHGLMTQALFGIQ